MRLHLNTCPMFYCTAVIISIAVQKWPVRTFLSWLLSFSDMIQSNIKRREIRINSGIRME